MFRVNKSGEDVWSFTGDDIFVNNKGENEVQIFDKYILLTDADSKEYKIDFNGNALWLSGKAVIGKLCRLVINR